MGWLMLRTRGKGLKPGFQDGFVATAEAVP